jgi:transposase InsO family protein
MNRTMREDLYARAHFTSDNLAAFRSAIAQATHTYNHFRPHQHLDNLTPHEYTQQRLRPNQSDM